MGSEERGLVVEQKLIRGRRKGGSSGDSRKKDVPQDDAVVQRQKRSEREGLDSRQEKNINKKEGNANRGGEALEGEKLEEQSFRPAKGPSLIALTLLALRHQNVAGQKEVCERVQKPQRL